MLQSGDYTHNPRVKLRNHRMGAVPLPLHVSTLREDRAICPSCPCPHGQFGKLALQPAICRNTLTTRSSRREIRNLLGSKECTQVSHLQKWNTLGTCLASDCEAADSVAPPEIGVIPHTVERPSCACMVLALFNEEITNITKVMRKRLVRSIHRLTGVFHRSTEWRGVSIPKKIVL